MDLNKLKSTLLRFNMVKEERKIRELKQKIGDVWSEAYREFATKCSEDTNLNSLIDEYKTMSEILEYSEETNEDFFETYPSDNEEFTDDYEYSATKFYDACRVYETWPAEKEKVEKEIADLKKKIFVFDRKGKNIWLNIKLSRINHGYEAMKKHLAKVKAKEELMAAKDERITYLLENIEKIQKNYAEEVANKFIDEEPLIICEEQITNYIGKVVKGQKYIYQSKYLNNAFNNVRDNVLSEMKQETEKSFKR